MRIGILPDSDAVADVAAAMVTDVVERRPDAVLGVATGSTPEPLYARLRAAHAAGALSLAGIRAYALDEYVGIDPTHPQAYRTVLLSQLVDDDATGLRAQDLHTPDGTAADPADAARRYEDEVTAAGVDLQILGIGGNGHIGFNEPGVSLVSRSHVGLLDRRTRSDNARFFGGDLDAVPTHCLTQGLATIMSARSVVLIATGAAKAPAVRAAIEGGVSSRTPASILQMHPDATFLLDEAAAADLELADLYRDRWDAEASAQEGSHR